MLELNPAGTGLRLRRPCECGFKGLAGTCVRPQLLARGQSLFSLLHIRLDPLFVHSATSYWMAAMSSSGPGFEETDSGPAAQFAGPSAK